MLLWVGGCVLLPHGLASGAPGALRARVPPENQQTVLPNSVSSNGRDKTSEATSTRNRLGTGHGRPEVAMPLHVSGDHSRRLHLSGWEAGREDEFKTIFFANGV